MRKTVNHEPPADMQQEPVDNTSKHVMAQVTVALAHIDGVTLLPTRLIHTQSAMEIAAWFQSAGPHGIGMARFASTGTITEDLLSDIARELGEWADLYRDARSTEHRTGAIDNRSALRALEAYVSAVLDR